MLRSLVRLLCALLLLLGTTTARAQTYWAASAGGASNDESASIAVDNAGNTYVTGYFSGLANFGTTTLTSAGVTDVFLSKYNASGQHQWTVQAGGSSIDRGVAVRVGPSNDVFLTGFFSATADFSGTSATAAGQQDVFVARYDGSGNLVWLTTAGGSMVDEPAALELDASGNIAITGQFQGTATFGATTFTSQTNPTTSAPGIDVFVARLDANGNFLWSVQGAAPFTDRGLDVAHTATGEVLVTGQFSDTITFGNAYNNNLLNGIFLIKFDANGNDVWFRRIGAATNNIAYGLACDNADNVYITGDFAGTLIFFDPQSSNTNLSDPLPEAIFLAKYDAAGSLLWATSDGSNSAVSARDVALDSQQRPWLFGEFDCTFTEYANELGSGLFNNVGFGDLFVARYSTSGTRQWMRHTGSQKEDAAGGLAINTNDLPVICGSYRKFLLFPGSPAFAPGDWIDRTQQRADAPNLLCGNIDYNVQYALQSAGGIDAFAGPLIDTARAPLDFYTRQNMVCTYDQVGVCIGNSSQDDLCIGDSLSSCNNETLEASTNTACCDSEVGKAGPEWNYLWSTNQIGDNTFTTATGWYWVSITSADACYSSIDSIYVELLPTPAPPAVSDSKGVNTNTTQPQTIELCHPDSAQIWVTNPDPQLTYSWSGGSYQPINATTVAMFNSGTVTLVATNSDGCSESTAIEVEIDTVVTADSLDLRFVMEDSISICSGDIASMGLYDTISNPLAQPWITFPNSIAFWEVELPNGTLTANTGPATHNLSFQPVATGWYVANVEFYVIPSSCGGDSVLYNAVDSMYIDVGQTPLINMTLGPDAAYELCPDGSTITYIPTGGGNYTWTGPQFTGSVVADTVEIFTPGMYQLTGSLIDSASGCVATQTMNIDVSVKQGPTLALVPLNGLICPGDSVEITVLGIGAYSWYGPNGLMPDTVDSAYVHIPGYYYVEMLDQDSCPLLSNTVEVTQYATPFIQPSPSSTLCPNDTLTLEVVTSDYTSLFWGAPIFSTSPIVQVTDTGTYSVQVTSCGITTTAVLDIVSPSIGVEILGADTVFIGQGDSAQLTATATLQSYHWSPTGDTTLSTWATAPGQYTVAGTSPEECYVSSEPKVVLTGAFYPQVTDTAICFGDSATLTAIGAGLIEWFDNPMGGTAVATGAHFTTPVLFATDTFYVQATDNGVSTALFPVVVSMVPASLPVNLATNSPVCEGDTLLLFADFVQGGNYLWIGPNGFTTTVQNPVQLNVNDSASGEYKLVVSGGGCIGPQTSIDALVLPLPDTPAVSFPDSVCTSSVLTISVVAQQNHTYQWQGPLASGSGPTLVVDPVSQSDGGMYMLTVELNGCAISTQAGPVEVVPTPTAVAYLENATVCVGEALFLGGDHYMLPSYYWTGPDDFYYQGWDATVEALSTAASGPYLFYASYAQCISVPDTVLVEVLEPTPFSLGADTIVCNDEPFALIVNENGTVQWSNGASGSELLISETGAYIAMLTNAAGCISADSINVEVSGCLNDVPNVFSPNGDGQNDGFFVPAYGLREPVLYIYDRWGLQLAQVHPPAQTWDGTIQNSGLPAEDGVYYWVLKWLGSNDAPESASGFLHLMR